MQKPMSNHEEIPDETKSGIFYQKKLSLNVFLNISKQKQTQELFQIKEDYRDIMNKCTT